MGQSIWQRHKSGIYRISNRSQTDLMTWMLPNRFIESQTNSTIIHHPSSLSNANLVSFSFAPEEVLWAMMHLYSVSALQSNSLVFSNERRFFSKHVESMSRGGWGVMDSSTCSTWAAIICHSSLNFAESTSAKLIPIQQSVKRRKCIPTVPFRKILFLLGMQIENIKRWKCQHGVI